MLLAGSVIDLVTFSVGPEIFSRKLRKQPSSVFDHSGERAVFIRVLPAAAAHLSPVQHATSAPVCLCCSGNELGNVVLSRFDLIYTFHLISTSGLTAYYFLILFIIVP